MTLLDKPPTLWHYTCTHGHAGISHDQGLLRPGRLLVDDPDAGTFVWLTDLDAPAAEPLGLTRDLAPCDRTEHRWRVQAPQALRWVKLRRWLPAPYVQALEGARGAMPMHWWVSLDPIQATYAPGTVQPQRN